jgi:hypothetical protein
MPPIRLAALFVLPALLVAAPHARAGTVDLALVLAIDVSESIDADEYELQHEGIARAFESPALVEAVRGGKNGGIEVLVLEWSDPDKQVVTVDWMRVSDTASAAAFSAKVRATKRSSNGLTAIGNALLAAQAAFRSAPDKAARQVVDVSGDGIANIGPPPQEVRDEMVAQGVTINGLAILKTEPWLSSYYDQYVVGGPGGFLVQVDDFPSFAAAMRQKLLSEVAAAPPSGDFRRSAAPSHWRLDAVLLRIDAHRGEAAIGFLDRQHEDGGTGFQQAGIPRTVADDLGLR